MIRVHNANIYARHEQDPLYFLEYIALHFKIQDMFELHDAWDFSVSSSCLHNCMNLLSKRPFKAIVE